LPSYPPPGSSASNPGAFPPPSATQWDQPGTQPYASWGLRVGGALIDGVIFVVVAIVLGLIFHSTHTLQFRMMAARGHRGREFSGLSLLISSLAFLSYATILIGGPGGATVGMRAVGLRAVNDRGGGPLGYPKALGRAIVGQIPGLLTLLIAILGLIVTLLDVLWPLWDSKRQTLHDKVVGTVVIRTRP
jgi:uncharacterized RDD family membrane protein YckC